MKLPDGVEPTIADRDFTIATIAAPTAEEEVTDTADAEGATPVPVIGEEKAEEGDEKED